MTQPAPSTLSAQDRASIQSISDRFAKLMLARDFDALTQFYAVNAILMPPNQPAVQGRTQIKIRMEAFPKLTSFSIEVQEIDGRDDLAYVRGAYSMTIEADGAPAAVEEGKFLEIRKKQPDGSWPLVVDMFSSDKA